MARNVALIILDTVRQDYFSDFATRLNAMSDAQFSQCRAASSCSVPSHASILTGKLPHQHGITSVAVDYSHLTDETTFFGAIPDHRAVGVSTNTFAGTPFGFDELFDEFVDVSWTRRFPDGMDAREFVATTDTEGLTFYSDFLRTAWGHDHTLATLSNAALARLNVLFSKLPVPMLLDDGSGTALNTAKKRVLNGREPFFLFLNLMEAHTPHQSTRGYDRSLYDVPNTWSSMDGIDQWDINRNGVDGHGQAVENFRSLYVAAIDYLDRKVATFIEHVQARTDRETTFIITSDHGENLGFEADDGMVGHTSSLSEGLLHVPLAIVNPPEGYESVEQEYFSQLELGDLIAGVAEGRTPDVFAERIAAERITTTNTPQVSPDERRYWQRMLRCVYEGHRKWVWDSLGTCVSFQLDAEQPNWQEQTGREDDELPAWAEEQMFSDGIDTYSRHDHGDALGEIDEATQSRLEELGYL